ncbi:hypothetical protein PMIN01_08936 [Paraphaeosphaeria minitans]|uniref:Uncharacterized protein n=1 Tax=Paraphaeosphaeria minitans TaxID=565426 RepID=A0A9P6KN60_9PLEO|nr:hypothetical protein PMIN01_08936 [Paraphaeosphaeria minitans]
MPPPIPPYPTTTMPTRRSPAFLLPEPASRASFQSSAHKQNAVVVAGCWRRCEARTGWRKNCALKTHIPTYRTVPYLPTQEPRTARMHVSTHDGTRISTKASSCSSDHVVRSAFVRWEKKKERERPGCMLTSIFVVAGEKDGT